MSSSKATAVAMALSASVALTACGDGTPVGNGVLSRSGDVPAEFSNSGRATIWDLFQNQDDPNVTVEVNKYIWRASLDVLDFLPIEAADPFTGVIVTGFGRPPGGGRAYRATVFIQDPALEARSLNLSLQTRGGPVSRETSQAVEDAILTRARQLRVADGRL